MLTGEILIQEGQAVVYASGAIRMKEIEVNGTEIVIGEDTFKELEEERKQYFPSSDAIAWCLKMDILWGRIICKVRNHLVRYHLYGRMR